MKKKLFLSRKRGSILSGALEYFAMIKNASRYDSFECHGIKNDLGISENTIPIGSELEYTYLIPSGQAVGGQPNETNYNRLGFVSPLAFFGHRNREGNLSGMRLSSSQGTNWSNIVALDDQGNSLNKNNMPYDVVTKAIGTTAVVQVLGGGNYIRLLSEFNNTKAIIRQIKLRWGGNEEVWNFTKSNKIIGKNGSEFDFVDRSQNGNSATYE